MKRLHTLVGLLLTLAGLFAAVGCGSVPLLAPPTATSVPTSTPVPTVAPTRTLALPTATASPVPTVTATNVPTPANPSASLNQIFKSWSAVKSFRAKMVSTGAPTGNIEMNLEFVAPDKYHMTMTGMELYLIAKTAYMKVGGKWQKVPLPAGIDLSFADPKKYETNMAATTDIKFVGADVLNGTPTLVYSYTTNLKGPPAQKIASKIWIGALDNLPRKVESEPKAGQKTTITFSDYNTNIAIAAPI